MGEEKKYWKSKRRRKKKRPNDGNNNGQATHGSRKHAWRTQAAWAKKNVCHKSSKTRLPGAVPQPIGLFLFCIAIGWGWTKLIIVLCMNLLVEVEIRWHTELTQAACVRHACLRAPCVAWPLLWPSFSLSFFLSPLFSPSFAFDPLRGNSRVRNNFCPNILL